MTRTCLREFAVGPVAGDDERQLAVVVDPMNGIGEPISAIRFRCVLACSQIRTLAV